MKSMKSMFVSVFVTTLAVAAVTTTVSWQSDSWASVTTTVKAGKEAPELKTKTIDGKDFDLSKLKGKVVLVDFWGTWCPPCLEELPHLREAYAKFHDKGLEIISIALRDTPESVKAFSEKHEMAWTHLLDEDFAFATKFQVQVVPTPFLIDHTGKIVLRGSEDMFDSDLRGEQLLKDIENFIKLIPAEQKEESA